MIMTVGELLKKLEGIDPALFVFVDQEHDGAVLTEIDDVSVASGHPIRYQNTGKHGLKFDHTGPVKYLLLWLKKD
jgi:hypothetical protein